MATKLFHYLNDIDDKQRVAVIAGNKKQYHKFIERFDLSQLQFRYTYRNDQIIGRSGTPYILIGDYKDNEVYYNIELKKMKELVL